MGTNPKASYSGLPASVASREMEGTPFFLYAQKNHRKFVSAWHKCFCGFLLFSLCLSLGPDRQCGDVGPVFIHF